MTKESEAEERFLEEFRKMTEGDMLIVRIADQSRENYRMSIHHVKLDRFSKFMNEIGPKVSACVVSLLMRPGASMYWTTLEHTWFSPIGPSEPLYLSAWAVWKGQAWVIGVIPAQLAWTFDEAAKRTNMVVSPGIPTVIDSDGVHQFPIPWVRTLENTGEEHHYKATEEGLRMRSEGLISPQEFIRRVNSAERGMFYEEFQKIKEFYHEHGLIHPSER